MEKIVEVKKEVEYFNNYLVDPKRPQLPEHPSNKSQTQQVSNQQVNYTSPSLMGQPGFVPQQQQQQQRGWGGGGYQVNDMTPGYGFAPQFGGYHGGYQSGYKKPAYNNPSPQNPAFQRR